MMRMMIEFCIPGLRGMQTDLRAIEEGMEKPDPGQSHLDVTQNP